MLEIVKIDKSQAQHAHELCRLLSPSKKGATGILADFDAVFTTVGEFAEVILRFLHANPRRRPLKVFTADITPTLLNLMREPDSALEAMCGVEPFSFGRLILRIACESAPTKPACVGVVQIRREDVLNRGIRNYAQLLAMHPKLLLDEGDHE